MDLAGRRPPHPPAPSIRRGAGAPRPRRRQRGSALPLGLALLLLCALLMLRQFSAAELFAGKQRVTTAADAAAYSSALWQARVLNYHAYSNRAILANEVAIAQAVTLMAWSDYFDQLVQNTATVGQFIPYVGPALRAAATASEYARDGLELGAAAEVAARSGWREALRTSQDVLAASVNHFALNSVAAEVARANDPGFFAWVLPGDDVTMATRTVDDAGRRRFADLVVASLDPFVRGPREQDIPLPLPSPCLLTGDPSQGLAWVRKRGATGLTSDLERWQAVDTLSLHQSVPRGGRAGGCKAQEQPLGWGAATAGDGGTDAGGPVTNPDSRLRTNARAHALAAADRTPLPGHGGIARIRELDYAALADSRHPVARLTVLARGEGSDLRTAARVGLGGGRLAVRERLAGDRVWAVGTAEVYFHRPHAAPERIEYASLLNPYWQVRLAETTTAERAAASTFAQTLGAAGGGR